MNTRRWIAALGLVASFATALFFLGCGKKETSQESAPPSTTAPAPSAQPINPETAASVKGSVTFEGPAPKPAKIDMSQDPACKGANAAEILVVSGGHVANVFVYVKEGLGNRTFDVPKEPVTLDQNGCKYSPHVLGVMTNQPVKIVKDRKSVV